MTILKGIIAAIIAIALVVSLIIFPFVYVADKMFLSEKFYTETLEDMGVYDRAYDLLMIKIDQTIEEKDFKQGTPQDSVEWIVDNVKVVLSKDYVASLMKEVSVDMVLYLKGESDEMPSFDLLPKYEALRELTASQLDAEKVLSLMQVSEEGMPLEFLAFLGVIDQEGEINAILKEEMLNLIFDKNQILKQPFMISSPIEAMAFAGMDDPDARIEALRENIIFYHRSVMVLLAFISFLTVFLMLIWVKKLRIPSIINGCVYGVAAFAAIVSGTMMNSGNTIMMQIINERVSLISGQFASLIDLEEMIALYGKQIISKGLILTGIAIIFFILATLFRKQYLRSLEPKVE